MISPFKAVIGGAYKVIETRLQAAIHLRFGLPAHLPERLLADIKRADQIAAYFEATELAGFSAAEATKFFGRPRGFSADTLELAPYAANTAERSFTRRFTELEKARASESKPAA